LRDAAEYPVTPAPETRELITRENNAQAAIQTGQDRIDHLKKQVAAAGGARHDSLQQSLDFALVQLELDQDELEDVKDHLLRSGADPLSRIQRQFNRHEAAEHALVPGDPQIAANNPDVNYLARNWWTQFAAWRALRNKSIQLQQALKEAAGDAAILSQNHNVLEKQVQAEELGQPAVSQQAATHITSVSAQAASTKTTSSASTRAASSAPAQAASTAIAAGGTISSLHHLSVAQKDLADLNQRIQDHQEIADLYSSWIDRVKSHQRAAMHGMVRSTLLVLLTLLALYLAARLVDHFLIDLSQERTRLLTLRVVTHFAARAVGVILILLVLFGTPSQMPTILGLAGAGAGLTVALKDFIVAFFGWFVLMGRNGIRVGDWVEINGVVGEVVEISLLRTIVLETGNWADTGHPTGRKVTFVNSFAITGHFFNFSTSGQWLWDEIEIMVPSSQDPYPLIEAIQKMVAHETQANAQAAEEEWQRATSSHHAQSVSTTPAINLRPTTAGVELHVRYITQAHERYATRTRLYQALVEIMRPQPVDQDKTQSLPAPA